MYIGGELRHYPGLLLGLSRGRYRGRTDKTSELNQPVYFKDVMTSVWKPGYVLHWGRGYAFVSTGEKKLWVPSKLMKIRSEQKTSQEEEDNSSSTNSYSTMGNVTS